MTDHPNAALIADINALIPQMVEDADTHRTWTTDAARADLEKWDPEVKRQIGDVEWHQHWQTFYEQAAEVMRRSVRALAAPVPPQCKACALIGATQLDYINDGDTGVGARALYHEALDASNHTCGRGEGASPQLEPPTKLQWLIICGLCSHRWAGDPFGACPECQAQPESTE